MFWWHLLKNLWVRLISNSIKKTLLNMTKGWIIWIIELGSVSPKMYSSRNLIKFVLSMIAILNKWLINRINKWIVFRRIWWAKYKSWILFWRKRLSRVVWLRIKWKVTIRIWKRMLIRYMWRFWNDYQIRMVRECGVIFNVFLNMMILKIFTQDACLNLPNSRKKLSTSQMTSKDKITF